MEDMDHQLGTDFSTRQGQPTASTSNLKPPNVSNPIKVLPLVVQRDIEVISSAQKFSEPTEPIRARPCHKISERRRDYRIRPYTRPYRERSRTFSENTDTSTSTHLETRILIEKIIAEVIDPAMDIDTSAMEVSTNNNNTLPGRVGSAGRIIDSKVQVVKKSKSLEDIRRENIDGSQPSHEMEFVSSYIQKLKVQD